MAFSTKFTYYSDFVVYPIAIVGLVGVNSRHLTLRSGETWLGSCLLGFRTLVRLSAGATMSRRP